MVCYKKKERKKEGALYGRNQGCSLMGIMTGAKRLEPVIRKIRTLLHFYKLYRSLQMEIVGFIVRNGIVSGTNNFK